MFRRRMRMPRRRMQAPIVSKKVQRNENISYAGTDVNNEFEVYQGVDAGAGVTQQDIPIGHKVYSIDVSVNFISVDSSTSTVFSWAIFHLRQDQVINTLFGTPATEWSNLGASSGRNQVFKSFMGIVGTEDAGSVRYNTHIKIPKQWHRIREGDRCVIVFNAPQAGTLSIGTRYKHYS